MTIPLPDTGAPPDPSALDTRAVRRAFGRAASTYDGAAVLQREVCDRMLARLGYVALTPRRVLDVGCGTGYASRPLAVRFAGAQVTGVDSALPMVVRAASLNPVAPMLARAWQRIAGASPPPAPRFACADIRALPFAHGAVDVVTSSLALQWMPDLPAAFVELNRVLATGGLLAFTTLGPDTLRELRAAFRDGQPHVSRFTDMHDIGDMLVHAGFADPVVDMEYVTLTYATPRALMAELKALGATNASVGRARGMMGRAALARVEEGLARAARDGRIPATFEVIHGHAWKAAPRTTADGRAVVQFRDRP